MAGPALCGERWSEAAGWRDGFDEDSAVLARACSAPGGRGPISQRWLDADVSHPDGAGSTADATLAPFVIIQPPRNVTGSLHLAMLGASWSRIMTRSARMLGRPACIGCPASTTPRSRRRWSSIGSWPPRANRVDLGRERYPGANVGVRPNPDAHAHPAASVGTSLDWGRLRFTMDEFCTGPSGKRSQRLYRDGARLPDPEALVNWCRGSRTSISDLEVVQPRKTDPVDDPLHLARPTAPPDKSHDRSQPDPSGDDPRRHGGSSPPRRSPATSTSSGSRR